MNTVALLILAASLNAAPADAPFNPTCKPPSVAVNGACSNLVAPKVCTFTIQADASNLRGTVIIARSNECDDALLEAALVVQLSKQFGVDK